MEINLYFRLAHFTMFVTNFFNFNRFLYNVHVYNYLLITKSETFF